MRPLDIDIGLPERPAHGYRVHTQMICFAWAPRSVDDKIKKLPREAREQARAAQSHLRSCRDSNYFHFDEKHREFLLRYGKDAGLQKRKRPLRFIEEEGADTMKNEGLQTKRVAGLECALWPHLYWHRNLCETVARAHHEARQAKRQAKRRLEPSDEENLSGDSAAAESTAEGEVAEQAASGAPIRSKLGRIKRGFIIKLLSPLIGYGADFELLQFVYDLSMWTTIGTK